MLGPLDIISIAAYAVGFLVYGYTAFSAFAIGRTLSDRIYRRQAIGLGVVVIILVTLYVFQSVFPPGSVPQLFVLGFSLYYATFIGTYYWIDASIRAARTTDPLFRDTLRWSKIRIAFWVYDIVAYFVFLTAGLFFNLTFSNGPPIFVLFLIGPVFIMIFSGVVALPIAAHRSKDKVLKKNLDWFGVYALAVLSFVFLWSGAVNATNFEQLIVAVVGGYFLYRSAKSLVPLYTFRAET
jgi:uncharacterized membrane protein